MTFPSFLALHRSSCTIISSSLRSFSSAVAAAKQPPSIQLQQQSTSLVGQRPTYTPVKFVKEDLEKVIEEVPEFRYYILGEEDPKDNVFATVPLNEPAVHESEFPVYVPCDNALKFSKLENGLRIASMDKGGLTASLGLFVNVGSRHEDPSNFGVSHMIENMAYHSSGHLSWLRTIKTVETLGAKAACIVGREHIVYSAECLRKYMPIMIPIMTGNVLFPRFLPWEMKDNTAKLMSAKDRLEKTPDALVTELLHTTAWHNNTLGHKLYASEKSLSLYDGDVMRAFMLRHFSPDNMVFVGVNVNHDDMCKWLMRAFVDYNAIPTSQRPKSTPAYTGGDCRVDGPSPLVHLAIAFETPGGWNSADLVPLTVLQSLMGGGGSFSTGGPGKGMYTRLFLNVLNRNSWVDSCMAFNSQYTDTGLFGLYMTATADQGVSMVRVMAEELSKMSTVTADELGRAKASLKASIWMNLECRPIVMEDVARQLLMSDQMVGGHQFCALVDAVTEADIKRVANAVLSKAPTVVAYGDLQTVPHYEQISNTIREQTAASKKQTK
eukprot:GHVS01014438.1.p1 GENE.GHVS01014438.1~~GHVS01014438.1.p1  ORF type:complete len:551 (+),score=81.78 GHVS01014438.1:67-1719(+)